MFLRLGLLFALAAIFASSAPAAEPAPRPNIVWIVVDDMSPNFSCYGEKTIRTPHVDQLATEGTRFSRAFVTAPVCSACRSALITGCYQTTIGAHHHRSGRGKLKIHLPGEVVPVPVLFQKAGYYTCIGGFGASGGKLGKTDYNFQWSADMYNGNDWSGRQPGQPFFMQVQLHGGKYRGQGPSQTWRVRTYQKLGSNTNPADVVLPPYYPRDPVILQDWADYLDTCRLTDNEVGDLVARLQKEQLLDNTVIFFMTDHGISHARGKQFLYDEGIHVPLVMRGPGIPKGAVREDLVSHIDLAATSLALAGIECPEGMQSRHLLAKDYQPRDAVFSARDRCDETVEHIRSVRTDRYKYVRNFLPARPHLQPNNYKDGKSIVKTLRELHAAGKLDALQEKLLFSPTRAPEELYDLQADPYETKNLAADPAHAATLAELRGRLDAWIRETGDKGNVPETAAMYDSDMQAYVGGKKKGDANREITERNIAQMKAWAAEGK